jgi:hypothetical protein
LGHACKAKGCRSLIFFKIIRSWFFLLDSIYRHTTLSKFSYLLQAMFIPSGEAHDTSYFMSRYIWNPEGENVHGGSDFEDLTDTCSSGSFSNTHDDNVSTYCNWILHLSLCTYGFQFIGTWALISLSYTNASCQQQFWFWNCLFSLIWFRKLLFSLLCFLFWFSKQ